MSRPRLRALVLTAGLGTRLRPLTLFLPKPLLPVCGEPVVGQTLRQLARIGCEAAILNLHHLGDEIQRDLGRHHYGLPLLYSFEEEIQGTGGALFPVKEFLQQADVALLVNGDALCKWPFGALIRRHQRTGAEATLLLHKRAPEEELGGGIGVGREGRIVQMRDSEATEPVLRRHIFAGVHALAPHVLDRVQEGPGDIIEDLYLPLLAEGANLQSQAFRGRWHDLGTPDRYLEAVRDHLGRRFRSPKMGHVSPLTYVAEDAQIQRSVLEAGVVVGSEAKVHGSVLLHDARVEPGANIRDSILGPGVVIPPSSNIEGRMVSRIPTGHRPGPGESILGSLSYTPLQV